MLSARPHSDRSRVSFYTQTSTAGLASASPLEFRELGPDKAPLLVCVFGRNVAAKAQVRWRVCGWGMW